MVALCLLLMVACLSSTEEKGVDDPTSAEEETLLNVLSVKEKAEGWQLLFDGKEFVHWRGFKMESIPPGWTVQDGTLHFDAQHGEEGFGDLITKEQYADFELSLEWKITENANSGILFRVTEDYDQEFMTGPEYQIIDDGNEVYPYPETEESIELEDWQTTGANYALHTPSARVSKPVGEWNLTRLVVNGPHVEHWLNGTKIVEYELWTDDWKEKVAATKFSEWPQYGLNKTGHIVLQDHGQSIWFRNLKIKPLDQAP
jgi:hypothetical protein